MTAVVERRDGLFRVEVDGTPCIAYPRVTGAVALGDDVIVNVQARELELGSGGFDVLYVNLTRGLDLPVEPGAHVMKLPYTPSQFATRHAEENGSLQEASTLEGFPIVCCTVHAQVAPACAGIGSGVRVAYVQVAGGALPVSLSDSVRALKGRGLVARTIAVGACFDGDEAAVSIASALTWAADEGFDVCVCSVGPGIVGTGSRFGHGAVAAAEVANAAAALGGVPILAVRASRADRRERHQGVSHHTRAVLSLCLGNVRVALPAGSQLDRELPGIVSEVDVTGWRDACAGLVLSHMGRGPDDDPVFFEAAFAAGRLGRTTAGR